MSALAEKKAHQWQRSDMEWYVDLPSCAGALFDAVALEGPIHDPFCGIGCIVREARRRGYTATGADASGRFAEWPSENFLKRSEPVVGNIVMNPAYGTHPEKGKRLEERAIQTAVGLATGRVCALLHLKWMAPRISWLREMGCVQVIAISPRPSMLPGTNLILGERPGGGMQDYAWYIFQPGADEEARLGVSRRDASIDQSAFDWIAESIAEEGAGSVIGAINWGRP